MNHGCACSWYSSRWDGIVMCQRKVAHIATHLCWLCSHELSILPSCRPCDEQRPDVRPDLVADNLLKAVEAVLTN